VNLRSDDRFAGLDHRVIGEYGADVGLASTDLLPFPRLSGEKCVRFALEDLEDALIIDLDRADVRIEVIRGHDLFGRDFLAVVRDQDELVGLQSAGHRISPI
jgi:hypothetical protein